MVATASFGGRSERRPVIIIVISIIIPGLIPARTMLLAEYHLEMKFVMCTLALWRLTHLFVKEDGPWDFVFRIRKWLGNSMAGKAMDCFYCFSIWMALPFAFIVASQWFSIIIAWLSLSGAACLLEQFTVSRSQPNDHSSS